MVTEVGSYPITATDVSALPLAVVIGANQGVYATSVGPSIHHIREVRRNCRVIAWVERSGARLSGVSLMVGQLTGSTGSDWLCIRGAGVTGLNLLVDVLLGSIDYDPVILLNIGNVLDGDVLRWRVLHD